MHDIPTELAGTPVTIPCGEVPSPLDLMMTMGGLDGAVGMHFMESFDPLVLDLPGQQLILYHRRVETPTGERDNGTDVVTPPRALEEGEQEEVPASSFPPDKL
jgi:hypothetical protein